MFTKLFILFLVGQTYCSENDTEIISNSSAPIITKIPAKTSIRLPDNVVPIEYNIELVPNLEEGLIDGKETIEILCKRNTGQIFLHLKNITINETSVSVRNAVEGSNIISAVAHEYDVKRDFYMISLENELQKGQKYILTLEFTSVLGDDLVGFYRGSYVDKETKQKRWYAGTQFEATFARRAFPCFDEPDMKAQFIISLGRLENMTTLSNMPLSKTEPMENKPGYFLDRFEKSLSMSTYIVAFVVSDFVYVESPQNASKTQFRVWARKDAIDQAKYALNVGPRILAYFEEYFQIEYPLPKLDMVALPDFLYGAMENWGLVLYRESLMLVNDNTTLSGKKSIASVVSHELAHQWFGNLVTMKWWSQLWLNEGFAGYMQHLGVENVEPDMKMLEDFVTDRNLRVMRLDALESSHPIYQEVNHPDEIDNISHEKAVSIIRMISHFLSERTLRKGLANYITTWKYNNTNQDALWESLTEQAHSDETLPTNITMKTIMDTWILQSGFPVVHVERNYNLSTAQFSQKRFLFLKNNENNAENSTLWWIPVSYSTSSFNANFTDTKPKFWLNEISSIQNIPLNESDWLLVNPHQTGFYTVNYDSKNWELLEKQLRDDYQRIPISNRAQIVSDALHLAQASLLSYKDALSITEYIQDDNDMIPWRAFIDSINYLKNRLERTELYGNYKSYLRSRVQKQYEQVGFFLKDNETLPQIEHRINIVKLACSVDNEECVNQSQELFKAWMKNPIESDENPIQVDVRQSVYCTVIRFGGERHWNFLWQKLLSSDDANEKNAILSSLACTRESWLLSKYLAMATSPNSGIRKQDSFRVYRSVAGNDIGCEIFLSHIADKWTEIRKYFGESSLASLSSVFSALSNQLNSPFDLIKIEAFKQLHNKELGAAKMFVEQAVGRVKANIKWSETNTATIAQILKEKNI